MDETITIRPQPACTIVGATAWVTLKVVAKFIESSRSHVADPSLGTQET